MSSLIVLQERDPNIQISRTYWDGKFQDVILYKMAIYRRKYQFSFYEKLDAYDSALALSHHVSTLVTVNQASKYTIWVSDWKQMSCLIQIDFRDFIERNEMRPTYPSCLMAMDVVGQNCS